jgi:PAS domain S-box-containing protein
LEVRRSRNDGEAHMKESESPSNATRKIRQRAEAEFPRRQPPSPSEVDAGALLHELQVHQIELEMQNEELQRAQAEAEQAAARYAELFDFAPVAYFVLDQAGLIRQLNFAGATLLGLERALIAGRALEQYVVPDLRGTLRAFLGRAAPGDGRRICEMRVVRCGVPRDLHFETVPIPALGEGAEPQYLLAATDVTDRKRAEDWLRDFSAELEHRVADRTAELLASNNELKQFNRTMVDRELRMIELKKEVNELCRRAGEAERYQM